MMHVKTLNDVRLWLSSRAPGVRWVSERELWRLGLGGGSVPDGLLEVDGRRHAIEVELTPKSAARRRAKLLAHCDRYDVVAYFCTRKVRSQMERCGLPDEFDKLVIREVPSESRRLNSSRWDLGGGRYSRLRAEKVKLAEVDRRALVYLAEQGAIPVDQLARFLASGVETAAGVVERLWTVGMLKRSRPLAGEPEWLWLTRLGALESGTGLPAPQPRLGWLDTARSINEARLAISARAPEATWTSGRRLGSEARWRGSRPTAVVETAGRRDAVVVLRGSSEEPPLVRRLEALLHAYDAVIVFCGYRSAGLLRKIRDERRWGRLELRRLPSSETVASAAKGRPTPPKTRAVEPLDLPLAALEALAETAGGGLRLQAVYRRVGGGVPRWWVKSEAGSWQVTHTRYGWRVRADDAAILAR